MKKQKQVIMINLLFIMFFLIMPIATIFLDKKIMSFIITVPGLLIVLVYYSLLTVLFSTANYVIKIKYDNSYLIFYVFPFRFISYEWKEIRSIEFKAQWGEGLIIFINTYSKRYSELYRIIPNKLYDHQISKKIVSDRAKELNIHVIDNWPE